MSDVDPIAEAMRQHLTTLGPSCYCPYGMVREVDDDADPWAGENDPYLIGYDGPLDLIALAQAVRASITDAGTIP